jgi:hypothetical protein
VLSAIILYPAFQAMVMRWWLSGIRLGGAALASDLRRRRFYAAYLQYILFVFLFSIVFIFVGVTAGGIGWAVLSTAIDFGTRAVARDAVAAGAGIVAYVIYILGCSNNLSGRRKAQAMAGRGRIGRLVGACGTRRRTCRRGDILSSGRGPRRCARRRRHLIGCP